MYLTVQLICLAIVYLMNLTGGKHYIYLVELEHAFFQKVTFKGLVQHTFIVLSSTQDWECSRFNVWIVDQWCYRVQKWKFSISDVTVLQFTYKITITSVSCPPKTLERPSQLQKTKVSKPLKILWCLATIYNQLVLLAMRQFIGPIFVNTGTLFLDINASDILQVDKY